MAEINTVIAEASQDLQTIEDFVNLPAGSDVRPRLLPSVNVGTLAGTRDAIFEAGGLPATPFATKALMTASALVDGQYAMVTDGGDDNGLYLKTAGVWVKSTYDPLKNSKEHLNAVMSSTNLFLKSESIGADFSRLVLAATRDYLSSIDNKIVINSPAATTEYRWRFNASDFKDGKVGAYLRIFSATNGGGTTANAIVFRVWQARLNGSTISSEYKNIAGEAAITESIDAGLGNIAVDPTAAFIDIGLTLSSANARTVVIDRLSINKDGIADYIPTHIKFDNVFFDPSLKGKNATIYQLSSANPVGSEIVGVFPSGATNSQLTYSVPAVGRYGEGSNLKFGAEILSDSTTTSVTMIFNNAAGATISRVDATVNLLGSYDYVSVSGTVPPLTKDITFRIFKSSASTNTSFKNVFLYSSNQDKPTSDSAVPFTTLHIDVKNGSDDNSGGLSQPLKTFAKALSLASANTRLIVAEGDYYEAPQMPTSIQDLEVLALPDNRVRMFGSTKVTGATKTEGRTKVYQIPYTAQISGRWLYQHGTPDADTLINITERRKWHNGKTHRLPDFTRIWPVASIAAIDSATKPSWFADGTNLYFSVVGGGSPSGIDVHIANQTVSLFYGAGINKNQSLRLSGIRAYHYLHGFRTWDMSRVALEKSGAYGSTGNGIEHSDTTLVQMTNCEFAANSNDGSGAHQYRPNTHKISLTYDAVDCWYHDNGDDGQSVHEMWSGSELNSLFEYNGDRGVATAVGAHTIHNGCESRKNGQGTSWGIAIDDGAGFAAVGSSSDGGISTDIHLVNCVSDGNLVNYNLASTETGNSVATLVATNCKSLNPVNQHYNANGTRNVMTLIDCGYVGAGTVTAGNATINIINSSAVTAP